GGSGSTGASLRRRRPSPRSPGRNANAASAGTSQATSAGRAWSEWSFVRFDTGLPDDMSGPEASPGTCSTNGPNVLLPGPTYGCSVTALGDASRGRCPGRVRRGERNGGPAATPPSGGPSVLLLTGADTMNPVIQRILLASPRGYCAGVERAVDTVEEALDLWGPPVYVRKQIVHNLHVVRDLEARGAVFVDDENDVPEGQTVVF